MRGLVNDSFPGVGFSRVNVRVQGHEGITAVVPLCIRLLPPVPYSRTARTQLDLGVRVIMFYAFAFSR